MKFKVIDKRTGDDITNDYDWVLLPNGELKYLNYCDLAGLQCAEAVRVQEATWIHAKRTAGGIHDTYRCSNCGFETGWTTTFCSNCSALMKESK